MGQVEMSRTTIRLTMAQALVKHLAALRMEVEHLDGHTSIEPYCGGVFTIFGHGNVAGMGEALVAERDKFTTYRAHNEQTMAHAAIAFSKAQFRQRIMAVSTSIGPGATNLVTAAAVAHVNRLPVLLMPERGAPPPVGQAAQSAAADQGQHHFRRRGALCRVEDRAAHGHARRRHAVPRTLPLAGRAASAAGPAPPPSPAAGGITSLTYTAWKSPSG